MNNQYMPTDMDADLRKIAKGLFGQHADKFKGMRLIEHPPYIFVEVSGNDGRYGFGFAKCNPVDTYDSLTGSKLAIHRAVCNFFARNDAAEVISELV